MSENYNEKKLLSVFFLLVLALVMWTSIVYQSAGQSYESGETDGYPKYNDSRGVNEQKLSSFNLEGFGGNDSIVGLYDETSLRNVSFFSFWNDPNLSCATKFKCAANFTTGWNDTSSIQVSTNNTETNQWSYVYGNEARVEPNERYELVSHLKHNPWSTQSHVKLEGYNNTSNNWYEIEKCPSVTNASPDWNEYKCVITIESNVSKVRPVLNAGWTSEVGRPAITWFDSIYMIKFRPSLTDPNLKSEIVYQGLNQPVSMQFLGPNDFLVIENGGTVQRITNGSKASQPLLFLNVSYNQGLLGIAVRQGVERNQSGTDNDKTYVFLYYTANEKDDNLKEGKEGASNRLYRYDLVKDKLVNPKKLLELPAEYDHNGGPLLIGPDKNTVYVSIGDLENQSYKMIPHKALNNNTGSQPDGSGGILRVTLDGQPVNDGILGKTYPLNLYYAYGIRECFGMDFDPVSGALWISDNGANWGDEINLVNEGFNGGWSKVQGVWRNIGDNIPTSGDIDSNPTDLVDFDGKGKYNTPQFTWNRTVGPTALKFISSDKFGEQYENDMLVADVNNGRIYHFDLNQNRTQLLLQGPLSDKIADNNEELRNVIFAEGFGVITDLKIDPSGNLYVVVFDKGKIYRISPS